MLDENYRKEIQWLLKEKYQGVMSEAVEADVERIKQGEPVAYVIGFVDFLGCKIDLSEKPLIPRAETELWVEKVIDMIYHINSQEVICLDMFAGSGCIGVSILKNVPSALVDFSDSEDRAIKQVKINCKLNNVDESRYQIIKSNMFEDTKDSYDYIFANPPYIAEDKRSDVQESVLTYEPHEALFSGLGGLDTIKLFLKEAKKHLNKDGTLYMEFDDHQKDAIEKVLRDVSYSKYNFYQDQFKKWRYLSVEP